MKTIPFLDNDDDLLVLSLMEFQICIKSAELIQCRSNSDHQHQKDRVKVATIATGRDTINRPIDATPDDPVKECYRSLAHLISFSFSVFGFMTETIDQRGIEAVFIIIHLLDLSFN